MKKNLNFISRHEPTNGQQKVAVKLGYDGLTQKNVFFGDDPVKDLEKAGILPETPVWENFGCACTGYDSSNYGCSCSDDLWQEVVSPTQLAGVFPLATALELLRAGFELVVFTNSKSARDKSQFVCTGADILTLEKTESIKLEDSEIDSVSTGLFAGARAIEGGVS